MSMLRAILLASSTALLLGFIGAQVLYGEFKANLVSTASLVASAVLLVLFIALAAKPVLKMKREWHGWKSLIVPAIVVTTVALFASTVVDVSFGASIRSIEPVAAFLPEGNLLINGGIEGLVYLVLVSIAVGAGLWPYLVKFGKWIISASSSKPVRVPSFPRTKAPKAKRGHREPRPAMFSTDNPVLNGQEAVDATTGWFQMDPERA